MAVTKLPGKGRAAKATKGPKASAKKAGPSLKWLDALYGDAVGATLIENQLFRSTFIIHPPSWPAADILPRFTWDKVKFEKASHKAIPSEPGLYAFVVRVPHDGLPPNGWILYIGQAGDGESDNTLHTRFASYLQDKKNSLRHRVYWFLNMWDGHLEFYYTSLPSRKAELKLLETKLLDAFRPPFTERGYTAKEMGRSNAF